MSRRARCEWRCLAALLLTRAAWAQGEPPVAAPFAQRLAVASQIETTDARHRALDSLLAEARVRAERAAGAVASRGGASPSAAGADTTARRDLEATLDVIAGEGAWGRERLATMTRLYPASTIVRGAEARRMLRNGHADSALPRFDALLRDEPLNPAWRRGRYDALRVLQRHDAVFRDGLALLDLDPGEDDVYRTLVRTADTAGLDAMLRQVRRLRVRRDAPRLAEREIELLQRLGRVSEAAALAASRRQVPPS